MAKYKGHKTKEEARNAVEKVLHDKDALANVYLARNKEGHDFWMCRMYCEEHGEYVIPVGAYVHHKRCPKCEAKERGLAQRLEPEKVLEEAKATYKGESEIVGVSHDDYRNGWNVHLHCKKHGDFTVSRTNLRENTCCSQCVAEEKFQESYQKHKEGFEKSLPSDEHLLRVYRNEKDNVWWAEVECERHGIFQLRYGDRNRPFPCTCCGKEHRAYLRQKRKVIAQQEAMVVVR